MHPDSTILTPLVRPDVDQRRRSARRPPLVYDAGTDLILLFTCRNRSNRDPSNYCLGVHFGSLLTIQRSFSILSGLCVFMSSVCRLAIHVLECVVHPLYPFPLPVLLLTFPRTPCYHLFPCSHCFPCHCL